MQISYTTSEDDFVRAGVFTLRRKSPMMRYLPWFGGVLLLVIIADFVTNTASLSSAMQPSNSPKLLFGIGLPALFVALPWLTRRNLRKQYRKSPIVAERRTLQADFSGLHFRSASATGDMAWSTYVGFQEDKYNFLLIQQGTILFVPVPKRELTTAEIDEVRATFETYLPRK